MKRTQILTITIAILCIIVIGFTVFALIGNLVVVKNWGVGVSILLVLVPIVAFFAFVMWRLNKYRAPEDEWH